MIKNKVNLITLGCSKNLVDSEMLMRQFLENGYTVENDSEPIDGEIVIINTCGFIGDAKEESIRMILEAAEWKKRRKIKKLFVMGCLSQRYLEELKIEIPEVDRFYGKFDWNDVLAELGKTYYSGLATDRVLTTPPHYAYLKIAEGCNRMCAYCSIPIITGRYRSRSIESIEEEVRKLVAGGVKEFQVIAQDLTYYGFDLYKRFALPELVERISDIPGVEWIRLHYGYPARFPYELLRVMRERENVCKYLDIALQHISDRMLRQMRRAITKQETLELLDRIRQEVPGIHLRTTLMVGHPGETDADFAELIEFVRHSRFERMGAFAYSEEEGTYSAAHYDDSIPDEVKQERLDSLMRVQEKIAYEINADKVGREMNVIVDRQEAGYYVGRTEFDSPEVDPEVLLSSDTPLETGRFYRVKIENAEAFDLYGSVLF